MPAEDDGRWDESGPRPEVVNERFGLGKTLERPRLDVEVEVERRPPGHLRLPAPTCAVGPRPIDRIGTEPHVSPRRHRSHRRGGGVAINYLRDESAPHGSVTDRDGYAVRDLKIIEQFREGNPRKGSQVMTFALAIPIISWPTSVLSPTTDAAHRGSSRSERSRSRAKIPSPSSRGQSPASFQQKSIQPPGT